MLETLSYFTHQRIEPQTSSTDSNVLATELIGRIERNDEAALYISLMQNFLFNSKLQVTSLVNIVLRLKRYKNSNLCQFAEGATIKTGAVLVHEMGHNFNLAHVNDGIGQNCPCTAEQCIMNATFR